MNLKNKVILLLFMMLPSSAFAIEISAEVYNVYSRLEQLATKSPIDAVDDIDTFYRFSQKKPAEVQLLAASLAIRNSLALNMPEKTLDYLDDISQLSMSDEYFFSYQMLGAQLSYQLQRYPDTINYLNAWVNRATTLAHKHKVKGNSQSLDADKLMQKKITPKEHAGVLMFLANTYWHNKNNALAISNALTAIKLTTRTESDYRFLFMLYEEENQRLNAENLLITMTELFPTTGEYWERLGYSYLHRKKTKQAIAVFDVAKQAGYLPPRSWMTLAQLFIAENMSQKATNLLKQIKDEKALPLDSTYYQLLTNSQIVSREHQAALATLSLLAKDNASSLTQQKQQAQIAYSLGKWSTAITTLNHLLKAEPNNLQWQFMLAICHYELKQYSQSKLHFEQLTTPKYQVVAKQWLEQIDYLQQNVIFNN